MRGPLIYERVGNKVYARYRDNRDIPRWFVREVNDGTSSSAIDWRDVVDVADRNESLKAQLDKLLTIYYLVKEKRDNE